MVKIRAPLMSASASGTMGEVLTFSQRKSGPQVRYQRGQKSESTPAREPIRHAYRTGVELWHYLPGYEKSHWKEFACKGFADV